MIFTVVKKYSSFEKLSLLIGILSYLSSNCVLAGQSLGCCNSTKKPSMNNRTQSAEAKVQRGNKKKRHHSSMPRYCFSDTDNFKQKPILNVQNIVNKVQIVNANIQTLAPNTTNINREDHSPGGLEERTRLKVPRMELDKKKPIDFSRGRVFGSELQKINFQQNPKQEKNFPKSILKKKMPPGQIYRLRSESPKRDLRRKVVHFSPLGLSNLQINGSNLNSSENSNLLQIPPAGYYSLVPITNSISQGSQEVPSVPRIGSLEYKGRIENLKYKTNSAKAVFNVE